MTDINRLERKQAAKDNADVVKNSGRGMNKGDARTSDLLIDYKFTESKSFSINIDKWRKHELDAFKTGLEPTIVINFLNHNKRTLAIVDWELLKELLDA